MSVFPILFLDDLKEILNHRHSIRVKDLFYLELVILLFISTTINVFTIKRIATLIKKL